MNGADYIENRVRDSPHKRFYKLSIGGKVSSRSINPAEININYLPTHADENFLEESFRSVRN